MKNFKVSIYPQNNDYQIETSDQPVCKPTIAQKRDFINRQLENEFPIKMTILFALFYMSIGILAITLQAILISNTAVNYKVGNGIWAGCFCIFSAFLKLNLGIKLRTNMVVTLFEI